MSHIETTLGALLGQLEQHNWGHWVYVSDPGNISAETVCFVIDAGNTELEEDDFTPTVAARNRLQELLSVHDLQGVRGYLSNAGVLENPKAELFAIQHYVRWDSYPSKDALKPFL